VLRVVGAWLATGLLICALTLACGPSASVPPTPSPDAFAVVRATSQAAYQAGQAALASGDYLQACVDFDTAKTNDPDNRADIQQGLDQALEHCLTPATAPTSAPAVPPERTLVVATIAAGLGTALAGTPAAAGTPVVSGTPTLAAAAQTPASAAATSLSTQPQAAPQLVTWKDPEGRFTIGAPPDWSRIEQPQTLVGTGVVEFRDPGNRAELDQAVDTTTHAVSPELYAASLELAMQRQVPGYASEQIVPGITAGNPSVRRVFTFTQRDANGQDHQARGFQIVIMKGSTPFLVSATAPADLFDQFSPTFEAMVDSFRFS
jgi:hypothetical protein